MLFFNNFLKNENLSFNSDTFCHFTNYIGFQYYAVSNLNNLSFQLFNKVSPFNLEVSKFKPKRKKLFGSQLRFWLNDFYIDGKDSTNKHSSVMIQCSKLARLNNTNFKY